MVNATGFTMMNLTARELLQSGLRVSGRPLEKPQNAFAGHHPGRRTPGRRRQARLFARRVPEPARYYVHPHYPLLLHQRLYRGHRRLHRRRHRWACGKNSEVYFPTGNGVMSASGIAFINTVFRASRGLEFYKGFRNPVALIHCTMPVNTPESPVAWMVWKAPVRQNRLLADLSNQGLRAASLPSSTTASSARTHSRCRAR